MKFTVKSPYQAKGDQPAAIKNLVENFQQGQKHQVLLGVTGSGKTFTMAKVIEKLQKPTLVLAHNKTLAAQLYQEFKEFFPDNAVNYFVSYYDYYQPEAYIPTTDTYIEKEADINDEIDKLRLGATANLLTRPDCIVVASVSCIYNLGSPKEYGGFILEFLEGQLISRETFLSRLTDLQYERASTDFKRGTFRIRGEVIYLWPAYLDYALRIETLDDRIIKIREIDPTTNLETKVYEAANRTRYVIYPAKHYIVDPSKQTKALDQITKDLEIQLKVLEGKGKNLEAFRLKQRVTYDLEMIKEFGFVGGIENYSRYFDGRLPGEPPFTLLDYFKENISIFGQSSFLTIVDESHMTLPQVKGMFNGDHARKTTLVDYGFRLPSAIDNRPLTFEEFNERVEDCLYVSATPKEWEIKKANHFVTEQLIRPTGLLDPQIKLRACKFQIVDLIIEIMNVVSRGERVLVTTLTKKMAEALTEYLNNEKKLQKIIKDYLKEQENLTIEEKFMLEYLPIEDMPIGVINEEYYSKAILKDKPLKLPKVAYLHSEIETLERTDILADLRAGKYDCLVGINLLREGLDLPEVSVVAILDADKEGFLRSDIALIQTMGRAARHEKGQTILYADKLTASMKKAIYETQRRRQIQDEFNQKEGITPTTIVKPIRDRLIEKKVDEEETSFRGKNSKNKKIAFKPLIINFSKNESIDLNNFDATSFTPEEKKNLVKKLTRAMRQAADQMDYELAMIIRDKLNEMKGI